MRHHVKDKFPQTDRWWTRSRNVTAPISLEVLMFKERPVSLDDAVMRKILVRTDPTNWDLTRVKRRIRILDHPKNLLEVLCARLAIAWGLTGNYIITGPNQYRFKKKFLNGEALRVFGLKATELRKETVANLVLVMDHVVAYFGPKECLSTLNPNQDG